ncbi:XylR N-terminal domain-containing protein [Salicibibacter kimchii]|uniref:PucR family transcriptional regulator n=1 Tax=Salicibibacter kimchii TaxID=2099786 RepID=A0A345C1Y7_9BACI|nr:XylR N-terminal domain-containing protein [Salicibibacter kimchii]AXF57218.1 PucR family transcriptional regulator [Salicibibacter kimchii]
MLNELNLSENMNIKDNGTIYVNEDRSILVSASAFGTLRRDLIRNIGRDRIKGFLNRYGWELGKEDAERISTDEFNSIEDAIYHGTMLHTMKGHVNVKPIALDVNTKNEKSPVYSIYMEGLWEDSYEAVDQLQFGISTSSTCYTLTGYASGYLTKLCNQTVVVKEVTCQAEGQDKCKFIAKSLDLWNEEYKEEFKFYQATPIVKELETTNEKLLQERNNLETIMTIHQKLMEEILRGSHLQAIASTVYETTNNPGIITDNQHNVLAHAGLEQMEINAVNEELKAYLNEKQTASHHICETIKIELTDHKRLISPIFLYKEIRGYASFIYQSHQSIDSKTDQMILERISMVSSFFLLLEKTKFDNDRRIEGHFLNEILRSADQNEEDILRRGRLMQLDLQPYKLVTLKYQLSQEDTKKDLSLHEEMLNQTASYFKNRKEKVLIGSRGNNIIFLIPQKDMNEDETKNNFQAYLSFLSDAYPNILFYGGISKTSENITKAKESYNESLIALRMAASGNRIESFDSIGIIGPLLNQNNQNEVKRISCNILGPLVDEVDGKKIDLLKTLYSFLLNGGNFEQTSVDIALSISGLRYRLAKIEELLDRDLKDPFYNYQLLLALQSLILVGELDLHGF